VRVNLRVFVLAGRKNREGGITTTHDHGTDWIFFIYIFFLLNAGHNLRLLLVAIPPDGRRSLPMQLMKIRFN